LIKIRPRKSYGIAPIPRIVAQRLENGGISEERLMRLQCLEPQRSVGRIMLGFPIVRHVAWAIRLNSVARPAGRFPNAGNVVARGRARLFPGLQRVDYGPPPAVEQ